MPDRRDWTRRQVLQIATACTAAPVLGGRGTLANGSAAADPERIRRENEHPGTRDWMASSVQVHPATKYRCPWIEGYVSKTSVNPGESISLHVSTNPPSQFAPTLSTRLLSGAWRPARDEAGPIHRAGPT